MRRTRKTPGWLIAGLTGALLCAGCTSTPKGKTNRYEGRAGGQLEAIEGNRELARKLAIKNPIHKREDERMIVQFDLVNKLRTRLDFAWTVDWLDSTGFSIGSPRHWEPISMGGYAVKTLSAVAPRPEATQWRFQVTSRNEVK
jgi:uncharacterized protein YcfL